MFCATVVYPTRAGSSFDFEHYANTLAPMYAQLLGTTVSGSKFARDSGHPMRRCHTSRVSLVFGSNPPRSLGPHSPTPRCKTS